MLEEFVRKFSRKRPKPPLGFRFCVRPGTSYTARGRLEENVFTERGLGYGYN